jgi:hypothetical protein
MLKRGTLVLCLLVALMVSLTVVPSASASPFCGGQWVNNASSCFGAQRAMSGANAYGNLTGVCVGGQYVPWVHGTASNMTQTWGNTW